MCLFCQVQNRRHGINQGTNSCLTRYLDTLTFDCRVLTSLFPVYRNEVFEGVVRRWTQGELGHLWLVSGHLFLTSKDRLKVFTFDFIPASRQQITETGQLGFYQQAMTSPVLDVISAGIYPNTVFVVLRSGHVQCWQFTDGYTWTVHSEFDLCNHGNTTTGTEVVSVCAAERCIYWCERRTSAGEDSTFCVCRRRLADDLETVKVKDIGPAQAVVHNCPSCHVHIIGANVLVTTRSSPGSVHVILVLNFDKNHVTLFVGDEKISVELSPLPAIDFRNILLQNIAAITKGDRYTGGVHVQFDPQSGSLAVLQEDGMFKRYHRQDDVTDMITCTTTRFPHLPEVQLCPDNWFFTQGVLGICVDDQLKLFCTKLGLPLRDITTPEKTDIRGVSVSHIPTVMITFYTSTDVYVLQKSVVKSDSGDILQTQTQTPFQTDGLQVACLSEERQAEQSALVVKTISNLQRQWKENYAKQPKSRLSQLVDPYLEEFWRLEELVGSVCDRSKISMGSTSVTVEAEVRGILVNKSSLPLDIQQSQTLWVCEKYPEEMLQVLTGDLQYDIDDLDTDQTDQWEKLLGMESNMSATDCSLMLFEHTCRLLFKLKPQHLMQFVQAAQKVSEQAVGVSAFIRRKQTFQYYKKALTCLPEPDTSQDVEAAVDVTVKLILASGERHNVERAIRVLLDQRHWKSALALVHDQPENSQTRACLLYIVMSALAQHQVLSDFAEDIFTLVPSCQSFLTFSDIISSQPDVKQSCLSLSAAAVFCQGPRDIPVSAIRPVLQRMLSSDPDTNTC